MRTFLSALLFFCSLVVFCPGHAAAKAEKVILDSDMVEAFDDGIAMLLLAKSPKVELLGVTTLSGNSWLEAGTANALRQLENANIKNVPVAMGLEYPLRPGRHEQFADERKYTGRGHDKWVGSFGLKKPANWQAAYEEFYGAKPTLTPIATHAVNFIIDTVRANPGEITIAAIGPCGNLALAVRMAPDIVPLIKRVIYMGGAFFQQGNTTPAAEFNWYFDPEAAKIVVRTPFREQIVLGLDVCEKVVFKHGHYERLLKSLAGNPLKTMLRNTFVGKSFESDPSFTHFVWDVLVAAIIIDPSLITEETTRYIDVNDQPGLSYGQSLAYSEEAPKGTQKARIVTAIDIDRFWDLVNARSFWEKTP